MLALAQAAIFSDTENRAFPSSFTAKLENGMDGSQFFDGGGEKTGAFMTFLIELAELQTGPAFTMLVAHLQRTAI
jgi:hypothetical protein